MEKASTKNTPILLMLIFSLLLFTGIFYNKLALAETTPAPGVQLAYFIGYHNYYGGGYYNPSIYQEPVDPRLRRSYWSRWKYVGYGCRSRCLVERWSGRIINCQRRC